MMPCRGAQSQRVAQRLQQGRHWAHAVSAPGRLHPGRNVPLSAVTFMQPVQRVLLQDTPASPAPRPRPAPTALEAFHRPSAARGCTAAAPRRPQRQTWDVTARAGGRRVRGVRNVGSPASSCDAAPCVARRCNWRQLQWGRSRAGQVRTLSLGLTKCSISACVNSRTRSSPARGAISLR